jgi:hypothetical protein
MTVPGRARAGRSRPGISSRSRLVMPTSSSILATSMARTVGSGTGIILRCPAPGCSRTAGALWLWWEAPTAADHYGDSCNPCALCPVHHDMVHTGLLTISGDPTDPSDPDGLTFSDGQGRRLEPARPRPPGPGVSPADAAKGSGLPPPDWRHRPVNPSTPAGSPGTDGGPRSPGGRPDAHPITICSASHCSG